MFKRVQLIFHGMLVLHLLAEFIHEHSLVRSFNPDSAARTQNSTKYSATLQEPWQRESRSLVASFP